MTDFLWPVAIPAIPALWRIGIAVTPHREIITEEAHDGWRCITAMGPVRWRVTLRRHDQATT